MEASIFYRIVTLYVALKRKEGALTPSFSVTSAGFKPATS
jgi:hypothetical protein